MKNATAKKPQTTPKSHQPLPKPDREPKKFTFTAEEFHQLGEVAAAIFDLSKTFEEFFEIHTGPDGLSHCLKLVADELDKLFCDVQERASEGGAA